MRDIIAMVLAGGRVQELSVLTEVRSKAAVPFAGQYRIIDFAISGLMRADVDRVGVVCHYRPASLIDHLGSGESWDFIGRGRGIKLLPPYVSDSESGWYRGTGDAVWRNLNFISDHAPKDVLILSGDHIHDLDLGALIARHRERDADVTMAVKAMDPALGRGRFGFAELGEDDRVVGYQEKPEKPRSDMVSLTVYLFRTEVLLRRLRESQGTAAADQIYHSVLPAAIEHDRVYAYRHDGYWNYTRSVDAYHQAHMDLLGERPAFRLGEFQLRTQQELLGLGDMPPTRFDESAECADSVLSAGVHISGTVKSSVLSPGVRIERNAVVENCVLLHHVLIREGARLDGVVADKGVIVGPGASLGEGDRAVANRRAPEALASGVTVIGKNTNIPAGTVIGRSCAIGQELGEKDWRRRTVASGSSVGLHERRSR